MLPNSKKTANADNKFCAFFPVSFTLTFLNIDLTCSDLFFTFEKICASCSFNNLKVLPVIAKQKSFCSCISSRVSVALSLKYIWKTHKGESFWWLGFQTKTTARSSRILFSDVWSGESGKERSLCCKHNKTPFIRTGNFVTRSPGPHVPNTQI